MNKGFFFDRDGVLIHPVYRYEKEYGKMMDCAPIYVSDLRIAKGARKLINCVKERGFIPLIITNQPDFLKKNIFLFKYEEITSKLCQELGLERSQIFECFHKPGFSLECNCKKPKPGLFLMAKGMYELDLTHSWMVGDSYKDIVASNNAGIENTIFLKRKKIEDIQEGNENDFKKLEEMNLFPKFVIHDISEIIDLLK